jgi:hypothetical protein
MTPAERAAHMAVLARKREASDKVRNREQMPESSKHIDQFTRIFGKLPAGRVTENGRTVTWGNLNEPWWNK